MAATLMDDNAQIWPLISFCVATNQVVDSCLKYTKQCDGHSGNLTSNSRHEKKTILAGFHYKGYSEEGVTVTLIVFLAPAGSIQL